MVIFLKRHGDATEYDITSRLDDSYEMINNQESERATFQRTWSDINLNMSNRNGFFSGLFGVHPNDTKYQIRIVGNTGKCIFRGLIENSTIDFATKRKWVNFDVFSLNKLFFEMTETTKLYIPSGMLSVPAGYTYVTVEWLLNWHGVKNRMIQTTDYYRFFNSIVIDSAYQNRQVRFWADSTDVNVGNKGRYRELAKRTTVGVLLRAFARYYNAEFYIDPETENLHMRQRNSILSDTQHNIDSILCDGEEPHVFLIDTEKYNYVRVPFKVPKPDKAVPTGFSGVTQGTGIGWGHYKYRVTYVVESGAITAEGNGGDESDEVRPPVLVDPAGNLLDLVISLNIPIGQAGVIGRRLYRACISHTPSILKKRLFYYLIAEIRNNTLTAYDDMVSNTMLGQEIPNDNISGSIWLSINSENTSWNAPIYDNGIDDPPLGKIFDSIPTDLEFNEVGSSTEIRDYNILDILSFFGREFDVATFQQQWLKMLLNVRRMLVAVKGIDFNIGETFISGKRYLPAGLVDSELFLGRTLQNNLTRKETKLELIAL